MARLQMGHGSYLLHTINSAQPPTKEWKAENGHTKGKCLTAAVREPARIMK